MKNKNRPQAAKPALPLQTQPGGPAARPTMDELQSIFDQALAFHRAGLLGEAEPQAGCSQCAESKAVQTILSHFCPSSWQAGSGRPDR